MRKLAVFLALAGLVAGFVVGCETRSGAPSGGSDTSVEPGRGIAWTWNDLAAGKSKARSESKKIFLYFGAGY